MYAFILQREKSLLTKLSERGQNEVFRIIPSEAQAPKNPPSPESVENSRTASRSIYAPRALRDDMLEFGCHRFRSVAKYAAKTYRNFYLKTEKKLGTAISK